ncbi:MAG: CooT family nickel-binding protein [Candidatus Bathyarchaeia archaeon]
MIKQFEEMEMCEFDVLIKGETVFKDAVYVKVDGNKVVLKDVLGVSKEIENCKIVEVDVNSERLVLSSTS